MKSTGENVVSRIIVALLSMGIVACGCASTEDRWANYTDEQLDDGMREPFDPGDCPTLEYCKALYPEADGGPRRDARGRTHLGWGDEESVRALQALHDCNEASCEYREARFRRRIDAIAAEIARRNARRQEGSRPPGPVR